MNKCPICQKRKKAIIENWVGLNKIISKFVLKPISESQTQKLNKLKFKFLLNLTDIYKNINYVSENKYSNVKDMTVKVNTRVEHIINECISLTQTDKNIQKSIAESVVRNSDADTSIVKHLLEYSIDKLSLEEPIKECNCNIGGTTQGKLLITAHRSFRDELVNFVMKLNK